MWVQFRPKKSDFPQCRNLRLTTVLTFTFNASLLRTDSVYPSYTFQSLVQIPQHACLLLSVAGHAILRRAWSAPLPWFDLHSLSVLDFVHGPPHTGQQSSVCVVKKDSNKWITGADEGRQTPGDWLLVSVRWKQQTLKGGQSEWSGHSGFTQGWLLEEDVFQILCFFDCG